MQSRLLRAIVDSSSRLGRCHNISMDAALSPHASCQHVEAPLRLLRTVTARSAGGDGGFCPSRGFATDPPNMLGSHALGGTSLRAALPQPLCHQRTAASLPGVPHLGAVMRPAIGRSGARSAAGSYPFSGGCGLGGGHWDRSHSHWHHRHRLWDVPSAQQLSFWSGQGQPDESERCAASLPHYACEADMERLPTAASGVRPCCCDFSGPLMSVYSVLYSDDPSVHTSVDAHSLIAVRAPVLAGVGKACSSC